ncbi:MAG: zf-HC2 domain-containing protein [Chloroflexota bacterium]
MPAPSAPLSEPAGNPSPTRKPTGAWIRAAAERLSVTEGTVRRWIRSGRLNPSCSQVYAQVLPYLDQELDADARAEVDRHLSACPGCDEHFAFDGAVLRFVRQRAPRPMMPAGLGDRLLARYRGRAAIERHRAGGEGAVATNEV